MAVASLMSITNSVDFVNSKPEVPPISNVSKPVVPSSGNHTIDTAAFEDFISPPSRDLNVLKDQVLSQLRLITDPDLYRDIVSLGFVKNLKIDYDASSVSFTLELTTPACPVKWQFVEEAERLLKELGWIEKVDVKLSAKPVESASSSESGNLSGISHIITVASCKGGVGKSSIACNMAYMLANLGARVGLVDADIYGPSLPYLIGLPKPKVYFGSKAENSADHVAHAVEYEEEDYNSATKGSECCSSHSNHRDSSEDMQTDIVNGKGGLVPVFHGGVKLMSFGYLRTSQFAAVRGPVASTIVYQMIAQTLWGELDYLIIDLPPGTGDVHLTIAQSIPVTAAIMVTTPQQLSLVDVERGILMFNDFHIPTIAIVENMSYYVCPNCNVSHDLYRNPTKRLPQTSGGLEDYRNIDRLADRFGISILAKIPLNSDFAALRFLPSNENGLPQNYSFQSYKASKITAQFCCDDDKEEELFPFVNAFDESHPIFQVIKSLCENVVREISILKYSSVKMPKLRMVENGLLEMVISDPINQIGSIKPTEVCSESVLYAPCRLVRLHCRCAECINEFTGKPLLNPRKIPPDITVLSLKSSGNYAIMINWSDGHQSLLSFCILEKIFIKAKDDIHSKILSNCSTGIFSEMW